jgi:hypothetical protein
MLNVYDCSNSDERLLSRKLGGPVINEFVGLLHKYAENFGIKFVTYLDNAQVVFTNDIFPKVVLESGLPLVKRMDGVHWQKDLVNRNFPFIKACTQADSVIFITEYSRKSFETLYYGEYKQLKDYQVIRHWTEALHVGKRRLNKEPVRFCAIATDWSRPEKRLHELVNFAYMYPETEIHLIGKCKEQLPTNMISYGYVGNDLMKFQDILDLCDAFLNLTCKDAATKTVCTAINNKLPALFANSGGVGELVGPYGLGIAEKDEIEILEEIPALDPKEVYKGYAEFKYQYQNLLWNISQFHMPASKLFNAIGGYFRVMSKVVEK